MPDAHYRRPFHGGKGSVRAAFAVAFAALLVLLSSGTQVASAHAKLVSSTPMQGENLPSLPAQITLEFTEPVGLEFSTIELYGPGSKALPGRPLTRVEGRETTVLLPTGGQAVSGVVFVVWRVVSGVDGHLTSGTYWFTVGTEFANSVPESSTIPGHEGGTGSPFGGTSSRPDLPRLLARLVIFATSALLLGGSVFSVLVIEPSAFAAGRGVGALEGEVKTRFAAIGAISAGALALALLVDLLGQTAIVAGTDYPGALGRLEVAQLLLSSTRYGLAWILKLVAAMLLASIMLFAWASKKTINAWEVAIAAASLMLLAEALSSHAAAAQSGSIGGLPIAVISDWLHLVVASLWAGGLFFMVTALFPSIKRSGLGPSERRALLGSAIPRFSRLAIASVLVLALTGSYNLLVHTSDLNALFQADYGWVLALKVILFFVVVALGARNFGLFRPPGSNTTEGQDARAEHEITRNVRIEVLLLLVAFSSAAALTLLPPPTAAGDARSSGQNSSTLASERSTYGDYASTLTVKRTGAEEYFELALERLAAGAPPLSDITRVFIKVTPQAGIIATSAVEGRRLGDPADDRGLWRASSSLISPPGPYLLAVVAHRSSSDDLKLGFRLIRGEDGAVRIGPWPLIEARISTHPSPPIIGDNRLTIRVVDAGGKPVAGVNGFAALEHPASGQTIPELGLRADDTTPGILTSDVKFDRAGGWRVLLRLGAPGDQYIMLDASLDVSE